jgi:hypothetical protein
MIHDTDQVPTLSFGDLGDRERRAFRRFPNRVSVRCRMATGRFFRGQAVNVSLTGAAVLILSDREPPKISAVQFRRGGREAVEVAARTVRVARHGRVWLMGCAFDQPLTSSEFKQIM